MYGPWRVPRWIFVLRHVGLAGLLGLALAVPIQAQDIVLPWSSAPQDIARATLGTLRGSASTAVWRDGALVEQGVRRQPDGSLAPLPDDGPRALYEIGSISKVFTGLLLAQAVERGELALDDTLGRLLKEQVRFAAPEVAAITLRQLVTHTSCLPRQFGGVQGAAVAQQIIEATRAQLWEALAAQGLPQAAPCVASYSNYAMAVLGELLAQRAGKPWRQLVQEQITGPLGMVDTVQELGALAPRLQPGFAGAGAGVLWDMQAFAGAGGLRASMSDLVRFGRAILAGRAGPLGPAAERLVAPLAAYGGAEIGYAVFILGPPGRRTYLHDGWTGAYRTLLVMAADTGEVTATVASNAQAPLPDVQRALAISRYPVAATAVPLDAAALPAYAGMFRVAPGLLLYTAVQEGRLYMRSTGGSFRAYIPVGQDRFARPAGGASLQMARDAQGMVTSATLEQGGRVSAGQRGAAQERAPQALQTLLAPGKGEPYVGRYTVVRALRSNIPFRVFQEEGQLWVAGGVFRPQPVFPIPGLTDRFQYENVNAQLQFERDAQGRVSGFSLFENGELRATRDQIAASSTAAPPP